MSEENKITILGEKERQYLAAKSAAILPKNPSEQGWNWEKILKTLYEPLLVLYEWLKQTQDQTNEAVKSFTQQIGDIVNDISLLDGRVGTLESEVDDIKTGETIVDKAKKDEHGNRITTTYATQNTLDDVVNQIEVTGEIVAKNAENAEYAKKDASGRNIEDAYASQVGIGASTSETNKKLTIKLYTPTQDRSDPLVTPISTVSYTFDSATQSGAGLMSKADKIKLDDLIATILGYINEHDTDNTAHLYLRQLIAGLQSEIDRLDGKGKSHGMIDKTQSELLALGEVGRNSHILAFLQNKYVGYTLAMGDLIYTLTVSGQNEHEWEYNGTTWVDNGAWTVEKASNAEYGLVKGDGEYINIVSGIVEVLKAKTSLKLGTELEFFTHAMLAGEFANRYTKEEVNSLLEQLKAVYGWEDSDLGTLLVNGTITKAVLNEYDMVYLLSRASNNSVYKTASFFPKQVSATAVISVGDATFTQDATKWTFSGGYDVKVIGVKLAGLHADMITYKNTNVEEELERLEEDKTDKVEFRHVGDETITYDDNGKVIEVESADKKTVIYYDDYGNVEKVVEIYKNENKTYETTFKKDVRGRVEKVTKGGI